MSLEQVLEWNPQVIFVQDRYPQVVKQIENDPQWQAIDAVKHHRVWLMPEYAKAWGYPMPEAWRWASCGWRKTLSCALPEHRCGQ